MSGYNGVPRRRMLWEQKPDCYNELVAQNIRRHEVESVLHCLHFCDNANANDDGYYKVNFKDFIVAATSFIICSL